MIYAHVAIIGLFESLLTLLVLSGIPLLLIAKFTKIRILSAQQYSIGIVLLLGLSLLESAYYRYVPDYHAINHRKAISDIRLLNSTLVDFFMASNVYPTTDEGLEALILKPDSSQYKNWIKRMDKLPIDPWGQPYRYLNPGMRGDLDIYSLGPDRVESEDDIGNWSILHQD